jgi:hypothetical protein
VFIATSCRELTLLTLLTNSQIHGLLGFRLSEKNVSRVSSVSSVSGLLRNDHMGNVAPNRQ